MTHPHECGGEPPNCKCSYCTKLAGGVTRPIGERWPEWWISDYDGSIRTGDDPKNGEYLDEQQECDQHNSLRAEAIRLDQALAASKRIAKAAEEAGHSIGEKYRAIKTRNKALREFAKRFITDAMPFPDDAVVHDDILHYSKAEGLITPINPKRPELGYGLNPDIFVEEGG